MTDTVNITLDKLVAWEGNVRQTATDSGIEELAASIAAHGLLQSLVVRKHSKSKHAVVAGGSQRHSALARKGQSQQDRAGRPSLAHRRRNRMDPRPLAQGIVTWRLNDGLPVTGQAIAANRVLQSHFARGK